MREHTKAVIKQITPPILLRMAQSLAGRQREKVGGEQKADYYDETFEADRSWSRHYTQSHYYFIWCVLVDRIVRAELTSVLDIGCGPGQVAAFLRDKGLKSYCGLDFSAKRVAQARAVCPEYRFVVADVFETDVFSTFPYDAVISLEFLEHVERDLDVIRRVRPGARFLGTVPNFPWDSHVRHFRDADEVRGRYGEFFTDFRVDTFLSMKEGSMYFLMQGTRI